MGQSASEGNLAAPVGSGRIQLIGRFSPENTAELVVRDDRIRNECTSKYDVGVPSVRCAVHLNKEAKMAVSLFLF